MKDEEGGTCAICGSNYSAEEARSVYVLVRGINRRGSIGVGVSETICPECNDLLTYDPWGDGNYQGDSSKDRPILKVLQEVAMLSVLGLLREVRVGSNEGQRDIHQHSR